MTIVITETNIEIIKITIIGKIINLQIESLKVIHFKINNNNNNNNNSILNHDSPILPIDLLQDSNNSQTLLKPLVQR